MSLSGDGMTRRTLQFGKKRQKHTFHFILHLHFILFYLSLKKDWGYPPWAPHGYDDGVTDAKEKDNEEIIHEAGIVVYLENGTIDISM